MSVEKKTSLIRNLGAFFGHIVKAVKTDPGTKRTVVRKTVEEQEHGELTLRRTTIEEIEFKETPEIEKNNESVDEPDRHGPARSDS